VIIAARVSVEVDIEGIPATATGDVRGMAASRAQTRVDCRRHRVGRQFSLLNTNAMNATRMPALPEMKAIRPGLDPNLTPA